MHTQTCSKCSGSGTRSGHPDDPNPCNHCVDGVTAGPGYKLVWFIYKEYGYPICDHEFSETAHADLEAMGFEDPTWNMHGDAHVAPSIVDKTTNEIVDEGIEEGDGWYRWNEDGPVSRTGWIEYLNGRWDRFKVKEQA